MQASHCLCSWLNLRLLEFSATTTGKTVRFPHQTRASDWLTELICLRVIAPGRFELDCDWWIKETRQKSKLLILVIKCVLEHKRGPCGRVSQVKNWNVLLNSVLLDVVSTTSFYTKLLFNVIYSCLMLFTAYRFSLLLFNLAFADSGGSSHQEL